MHKVDNLDYTIFAAKIFIYEIKQTYDNKPGAFLEPPLEMFFNGLSQSS